MRSRTSSGVANTFPCAHVRSDRARRACLEFRQQRGGRTKLARRAEAALETVLLEEGLLQWRERLAAGEAFDRRDRFAFVHHRQGETGIDPRPSTNTVQAPHWPRSQPFFVPVSPAYSRRASSRVTRGSQQFPLASIDGQRDGPCRDRTGGMWRSQHLRLAGGGTPHRQDRSCSDGSLEKAAPGDGHKKYVRVRIALIHETAPETWDDPILHPSRIEASPGLHPRLPPVKIRSVPVCPNEEAMDMHSAYTDLYGDIVRDHGRDPYGAGALHGATATAESSNALCGDRIAVSVRLNPAGSIAAIGHSTDGCLLCIASASMMATHAIGLNAGELTALRGQLRSLIVGEKSPDLPGEMNALAGVVAFPSRRGCVMLPWEALSTALREVELQAAG